jgi:hypothetical protein
VVGNTQWQLRHIMLVLFALAVGTRVITLQVLLAPSLLPLCCCQVGTPSVTQGTCPAMPGL